MQLFEYFLVFSSHFDFRIIEQTEMNVLCEG